MKKNNEKYLQFNEMLPVGEVCGIKEQTPCNLYL